MTSRAEITSKYAKAFVKASKKQKGQVLDAFVIADAGRTLPHAEVDRRPVLPLAPAMTLHVLGPLARAGDAATMLPENVREDRSLRETIPPGARHRSRRGRRSLPT